MNIRTHLARIACITAFLAAAVAAINAQPLRTADSINSFWITPGGGIDRWGPPLNSSTEKFSRSWDGSKRYVDLSPYYDTLSINMHPGGYHDYSPKPRNLDSILRGPCYGQDCKADQVRYLMGWSTSLDMAHWNSMVLRFEAARHVDSSNPDFEIIGFIDKPGLTGSNVDARSLGATYHPYLLGSARPADTAINALHLDVATHSAGIALDTFYTEHFVRNHPNVWSYASQWNRKMLARLRVRVNDYTWPDSLSPNLFKFEVHQQAVDTNGAWTTLVSEWKKADSYFVNRGVGWDTVDFRFSAVVKPFRMRMVLEWADNVSMYIDHIDVMTAHIDTLVDQADTLYLRGDEPHLSPFLAQSSGEDWLYTDRISTLVHSLKSRFGGKANLIQVGDEPKMGWAWPAKRFIKLLRDSTGGDLEIAPFLQDSIYESRHSVTSSWDVLLEGVQRGWYDSTRYADLRFFMIDPYPFDESSPLPIRTLDTVRQWEAVHAPTMAGFDYVTRKVQNRNYAGRQDYRKRMQEKLHWYTEVHRMAQRATQRDPKKKYGEAWWGGAGMRFERFDLAADTVNNLPKETRFYPRYDGRQTTGAEAKASMHLGVSTGVSGYLLYRMMSGSADNNAWGINGGFFKWDGDHSSNYHNLIQYLPLTSTTGFVDSNVFWTGFKERFDTIKTWFPIIRRYADTLMKSNYLGNFFGYQLKQTDSLPFVYNSLVTIDDSGRKDMSIDTILVRYRYGTEDTRHIVSHVHLSSWASKTSAGDTLLYITNMRTDDSYDTTSGVEKVGTFDRRYVSMQLKRNTLVNDIMDTLYNREVGRVRTPYVGAGDSLVVWLNPGEGILVRLMAAPAIDSFKKMQVAINLQKGSNQFLDHGTLHLDRPIQGVKNRFVPTSPETWDTAWTVPSSRYSFLGIKDNESVVMRQDSVLYRSPATTREGLWRHQNWTSRLGSSATTSHGFKKELEPSLIRPAQFSTDSLAHSIVIKMDAEGSAYHSVGPVRLVDPWYVDTISYDNQTNAREKTTPFLPHLDVTSGFDHQRYGGVFLKQDERLQSNTPNYSLKAFSTIKDWPMRGVDSLPPYVEWSFLHWHRDDDSNPLSPEWFQDSIELGQEVPVVFMRDSAEYTARYKRHMVSYNTGALQDSGFAWNNQRKLYFLYRDSLDRPWYRIVYSSFGRIYTAIGYRIEYVPLGQRGITWYPEQLLTHWDGDQTGFPSLAVVNGTNSNEARYAYEVPLEDKIYVTKLKPDGRPDKFSSEGWDLLLSPATAVIASVLNTNLGEPTTAIAWAATDGIHLSAFGDWNNGIQPDNWVSDPIILGTDTTNCRFPTIWMDTLMRSEPLPGGQSSKHFALFVSWQEDTTIWTSLGTPLTKRDVKVAEFDVRHDLNSRKPVITPVSGTINLSRSTRPASSWSQHPCITGMRVHDDSLVVRIAYESDQGPFAPETGIAVSHWRTGGTWSTPTYIYDYQMQSVPFTVPTIEIVRYFMADTGLVVKEDWYSLAFGVSHDNNLWQMALENSNTRVGPVTILGASNPQLAVIWNKADSNLEVSNLALGQNPRWVAYSIGGYFKLAGNDTLFGYTTITELDSTETYSVQYGYGELEVDSGYVTQYVDPIERPDRLRLSGTVSSDTVMRSQLFTLPSQGTLRYFAYAAATDSGYFAQDHDSIRYVLDFHDSVGTFITRLDSLDLRDTLHKIRSSREIAIDRGSAKRGYVVMKRLTKSLLDADVQWNAIVSIGRQSEASNKRTTRRYEGPESNIRFSAINDLGRQAATLELSLPATGDVHIDLLDLQGRSIKTLAERPYRAGSHELRVNLNDLVSGIYVARLQFGNFIKVARLVVVR